MTWVILLIIIVFDPLALILLISSQVSFQKFRECEQDLEVMHKTVEHHDLGKSSIEDHFDEVAESLTAAYPRDSGPIPEEYLKELQESAQKPTDAITTSSTLFPEYHFGEEIHEETIPIVTPPTPIPKNMELRNKIKVFPSTNVSENYVQNEEQVHSNLWSTATTSPITPTEYLQSIKGKQE